MRTDSTEEPLPGLPRPAAERVTESVEAARLLRRDRTEVADELAAHFEDALASGRELSALLQDFGDPALTGPLIGRSARRRRRAGSPTLRAVRLFSLAVGSVYLAVFVRLHARAPEAAAVSPGVTREDVLALWSPASMPLADTLSRGRALVADARDAARTGNPERASEALLAALGVARELARGPSPANDLAALRLAAELGPVADEARRSGEIAWRPEKVRAAFESLLASMYTEGEDGRLTAAGLRIYQAWKGKTDPSLAALLLEPVYFPNPASRAEVRREFDRFLRLAAGSRSLAFERERRLLDSSRGRALRYVALQIPLAHIAAVREASSAIEAPRTSQDRSLP